MPTSFTIDTFDTPYNNPSPKQDIWLGGTVASPTIVVGYGPNPHIRTGQPTNQVIGGSRKLALQMLSNTTNTSRAVRCLVQPTTATLTQGYYRINNAVGASGISTLTWDANGAGLGSTGQGNFLGIGEQGKFTMTFVSAPTVSGTHTLTVKDSNDRIAAIPKSHASGVTTIQWTTTELLGNNPLVDFSNLKSIEIASQYGASVNVNFDSISYVSYYQVQGATSDVTISAIPPELVIPTSIDGAIAEITIVPIAGDLEGCPLILGGNSDVEIEGLPPDLIGTALVLGAIAEIDITDVAPELLGNPVVMGGEIEPTLNISHPSLIGLALVRGSHANIGIAVQNPFLLGIQRVRGGELELTPYIQPATIKPMSFTSTECRNILDIFLYPYSYLTQITDQLNTLAEENGDEWTLEVKTLIEEILTAKDALDIQKERPQFKTLSVVGEVSAEYADNPLGVAQGKFNKLTHELTRLTGILPCDNQPMIFTA